MSPHTKDSSPSNITGATILLENVTKTYGGKKPAVDQLTLEIPAGQTVMFVGPSGCGKTTTLKMINRLIEPTSGRIVINGEDVTSMNSDKLRRGIGYVIQAGGLLPHLTVGANIGLVPKMLKWDKQRIAERTDELLDLVSLDPTIYRDRYPKELSGGQQQRVGVARALAADPSILLMDEPFGAVDPITRQRLQEELLHIQSELHKTIVFVTHDFDEAVKLGDWIVIFNVGGHIEQYGTPEQILARPASKFVEDFIGSGAGLKQLGLARVRDTTMSRVPAFREGDDAKDAALRVSEDGHRYAVVVDANDRPLDLVSVQALQKMSTVTTRPHQILHTVGESSTLDDALDTMLVAGSSVAVVTGPRGRYRGLLHAQTIISSIDEASSSDVAEVDLPVGHNTGQIPIATRTEDGIVTYRVAEGGSSSGDSAVPSAEALESEASAVGREQA
ncbi:ABC transporter ATP-binding protein [Rothia nasisuis]|uniref:ABC transporter ATP-binding protein n=1 Tax=Rothia nasisuis TaxID=2109647 RepID=UPI0023519FA0|nr:ABC transporter ATP-binding protein [Rothia nasisuis]